MTTARDIVSAALRKIGVLGIGATMDADTASDSLFTLNTMMHAWKARGVDVEHTDLSLSDTFPLAPELVEGTIYLLASRLAPEFTLPQSFDADVWWRDLQAAHATVPTLTVPAALRRPPSRSDRDGTFPVTT